MKEDKGTKKKSRYKIAIPYSNENRDSEKDLKMKKSNIKVMIILIILFLIGIFIRWDYIASEIDIDRYINPEKTVVDTINQQ